MDYLSQSTKESHVRASIRERPQLGALYDATVQNHTYNAAGQRYGYTCSGLATSGRDRISDNITKAGDRRWSAGDCAEPGGEVGFDVAPGNNNLPTHFGVPDASACLDHCFANARCQSAIFSKTASQTTGACYLKEQPHTAKVPGKPSWTVVWCNPSGARHSFPMLRTTFAPSLQMRCTWSVQVTVSVHSVPLHSLLIFTLALSDADVPTLYSYADPYDTRNAGGPSCTANNVETACPACGQEKVKVCSTVGVCGCDAGALSSSGPPVATLPCIHIGKCSALHSQLLPSPSAPRPATVHASLNLVVTGPDYLTRDTNDLQSAQWPTHRPAIHAHRRPAPSAMIEHAPVMMVRCFILYCLMLFSGV